MLIDLKNFNTIGGFVEPNLIGKTALNLDESVPIVFLNQVLSDSVIFCNNSVFFNVHLQKLLI